MKRVRKSGGGERRVQWGKNCECYLEGGYSRSGGDGSLAKRLSAQAVAQLKKQSVKTMFPKEGEIKDAEKKGQKMRQVC